MMQLFDEFVATRVNAGEAERWAREREELRRVRERSVVVRWREALAARRIVRAAAAGAGRTAVPQTATARAGETVTDPAPQPSAAPVGDLARTAR